MINNDTPQTHSGLRVLIAGGGIAGLSLARALKDAGHDPLVIERSQEWPATSTAYYLPTNAIRALDQLGLGEAVAAAAHPISQQRVTGAGGAYWLTFRCRPSGVNRVVARRSVVTACMSCCSKQRPISPSVSAPPSSPAPG
jgi:2-polyprenyl-6-methoxyphenol hydroxylase-like FAD-dependent oxidoreductase